LEKLTKHVRSENNEKEATKAYTVYSRRLEVHLEGLGDTFIVESQDLLGSKGLSSADS